jgi:hypothetical protein
MRTMQKRFFFEKKNQKTFANLISLYPFRPQPKQSKVFCFFFFKKEVLASLPYGLPPWHHPHPSPPPSGGREKVGGHPRLLNVV